MYNLLTIFFAMNHNVSSKMGSQALSFQDMNCFIESVLYLISTQILKALCVHKINGATVI